MQELVPTDRQSRRDAANVSRTALILKVKAGCACEVTQHKTLIGLMQVRMSLSLIWVCIGIAWGERGEKWSVPDHLQSHYVHRLSPMGMCVSLAHGDHSDTCMSLPLSSAKRLLL